MALSEPLIIAGTQPELIGIAPIALLLKRLRVRFELLYAGQQYRHGLSQTLIAELGLTDLDRLSVSDEAILSDVDRLRSNVRGGNVSADRNRIAVMRGRIMGTRKRGRARRLENRRCVHLRQTTAKIRRLSVALSEEKKQLQGGDM